VIFQGTVLASLETTQKARLLHAGKLVSLRRQAALPQEYLHSWLLVMTGILRVETECARQPATAGFLKKNEFTFFGRGVADISDSLTRFSVRAVLATDILAVPADVMHDMMVSNSRLATAMLYSTLDRAHKLYQNVAQITSTTNTEVAVGRTLFQLSTPREDGRNVVDRRISQREIAESLGLSREQVNKVMRQMETRGLVQKDDTGYALGDEITPTNLAPLMPPESDYDEMQQTWRASREREAAELRAARTAEVA